MNSWSYGDELPNGSYAEWYWQYIGGIRDVWNNFWCLIFFSFIFCFLLKDKAVNHFFSATQTYSEFFHKPSNQNRHSQMEWLVKRDFEGEVPKDHLSEKAASVNLCCATDKERRKKKKGSCYLEKKISLLKSRMEKKPNILGHTTWKKSRAWWKEREQ